MVNGIPEKQLELFGDCPQQSKYPLKWALGIVEQLAGKYPRVTKIVDTKYGITSIDKALWLANDSKRWPLYRAYIKRHAQPL